MIEESPSPSLNEEVRKQLHLSAVAAAKAVEYRNAGTVEFILSEQNDFYFLEMNTRLQVEHPVTEAVTGYDLVEWQIEVARGNGLPVKEQEQIKLSGHAIEYRIYAEDPVTFMPSPGKISKMESSDTDVRIDAGYEEGRNVTPFYDPMIAKVIVHGDTREEAIRKSMTFFESYHIEGVKSNISLFRKFIGSSEFGDGDYNTSVLMEWLKTNKEDVKI